MLPIDVSSISDEEIVTQALLAKVDVNEREAIRLQMGLSDFLQHSDEVSAEAGSRIVSETLNRIRCLRENVSRECQADAVQVSVKVVNAETTKEQPYNTEGFDEEQHESGLSEGFVAGQNEKELRLAVKLMSILSDGGYLKKSIIVKDAVDSEIRLENVSELVYYAVKSSSGHASGKTPKHWDVFKPIMEKLYVPVRTDHPSNIVG